ncbi:hypothetical protein TREMEDRAFT_74941 [Tremella mesenterica DSM 1558]|uniref:uncharacterized protein n=1 Tax=Tremella mesenterica (strain ATCC 24925 / CBS 8224 / DSM 1558 / NBRC 9311 / NRRL Y-6157 / RJB 2259-6 / UBC 559-6) TaxID=578456 RepID=UPI00032CCFB3|nr:uncharacterized protein TREMEDRAFT_74941 [Tremella mesenterica DSM 1558]EIW65846.1 hypothetical protein TREMEDRAFT_74941 [Tremella mesenterica DSM 1558]
MSEFYPSIYTLPQVHLSSNGQPSDTFIEQSETERIISQLLLTRPPPALQAITPLEITNSGENGEGEKKDDTLQVELTKLRTQEHATFLGKWFFSLPAGVISLDASRPWLMFWVVHSLDLLGVILPQPFRDRSVATLLKFLHPQGGFGGGPVNTHLPQLLPTYASICSLAIVGGPGEDGGWSEVAEARQRIYEFFMRCKQPDGSFVVCEGGEVDVRGTYCLLVVACLLDLLTPELLHNVDRFISACQTYEGGFSCSAYPFSSTSPSSNSMDKSNPITRAPMAEAHGGYTSCSLNSSFLLRSIVPPTGAPSLDENFPSPIDVESAIRWSVLMQGEAIEAGGFKGRSNKLVDGCYSWWVGGGFPVLEELARREAGVERPLPILFDNVALQEYILVAAQNESGAGGGLRDKPGKRPDAYHTCNNLSGLSIAQHHMIHSPIRLTELRETFDSSKGLPAIRPVSSDGGWKSEEERQSVRREVWASILAWDEEGEENVVGGKRNRVNATAPVINILLSRVKPFINYFYQQE